MSNPTSSFKTYLMYKADGKTSYEKLVDVKEIPDLGSAPNTLDATTLSDSQKVYVNDIFDPGSLEFTANYDADDFDRLKAIEGERLSFAVWMGAEVTEGKFEFEGELAVWAKGASVSAIRDMGIAIAPATPIKKVIE